MTDQSPSPLTENDRINEIAALAAAVAESVAKVDIAFPTIGFIDPAVELEKMRRLSADMPEDARRAYPEQIRAKLLASHASPTAPTVSDEELALAIFIRRTTDSPLTVEDVEAKTTGKSPRVPKEPKAPRAKKEKPAAGDSLDSLLGL